jgi:hypothetical protein
VSDDALQGFEVGNADRFHGALPDTDPLPDGDRHPGGQWTPFLLPGLLDPGFSPSQLYLPNTDDYSRLKVLSNDPHDTHTVPHDWCISVP